MGWCDGVCLPVYGMERMGMERYLIVMGRQFQWRKSLLLFVMQDFEPGPDLFNWLLGEKGRSVVIIEIFILIIFPLRVVVEL